MRHTKNGTRDRRFERVRSRFERWRKTREGHPRIPETLWRAAARLAPRYSVHEIARALRLNHTDLKKRVEAVEGEGRSVRDGGPTFSREVLPANIQRVAAKFKLWRKQKSRGERIPDRLWAAAIRLSKTHGICPVATALGLAYYDLKRRIDPGTSRRSPRPARRNPSKRSPPAPEFVEVALSREKPECVLELENLRGEKLRMVLRGASLDVETLTRLFWSGGK